MKQRKSVAPKSLLFSEYFSQKSGKSSDVLKFVPNLEKLLYKRE
jgi:hypothetical protein